MKIRFHATLAALAVTAGLLPMQAQAKPTDTQLCESAITLASAKFAQCRLSAESKAAKGSLTGQKFTDAVTKCSTKLSAAYTKTTTKYGMACAVAEASAAFDGYLTQCSNDTAAAAGGAALPNYPATIATCNADLSTCSSDLSTCTDDLSTCSDDLSTCTTDLGTAQSDLTTCQGDLATCEAQPAGKLLRTAQTTCWNVAGAVIPCAGTGQDGQFQKGIALSYTDNGDGTITDANTGLMWEKLSDDGSVHDRDTAMNWTAAFTKVGSLNSGSFAGHNDWRLPNVKELESILNYAIVNPPVSSAFSNGCVPSCTVLTCSCTRSDYYWSSSSTVISPNNAWVVSFFDGGVATYLKTNTPYVRAVRGGF